VRNGVGRLEWWSDGVMEDWRNGGPDNYREEWWK